MPFDQNKPTTLADALARLAKSKTTDTRQRDRLSAINRVATMLGRNPADVPCDAPSLRHRLVGLHPVQHGLNAKSLANIKSALADALRATGCLPEDDPGTDRTTAWEAFLASASAPHQAWSLSRFTSYCCHRGIEPEAVDDGVMSAFQAYLDARLLTNDPFKLCKEMCQTWNGIVSRNGLPLASLTYEKGGQYRCRPLAIYPAPLRQEIATYIGRLSHVDIFDEEGPDKPLRPTSLRNTEAHVRQYLDGLVCAGADPQDLTTLAAVITPEKMKDAFRAIMTRRGANSKPVGLQNIAATMTAIARHHLKLDDKDLASIVNIKKRVTEDPKGMSQKNRERLGQFKDWENVVNLINLPAVLMEKVKGAESSRGNALVAMHAAAIAILLSCPVRAKNLASLDLDRHIILRRNGTHSLYTLRIEGAEVKNGEPIEAQLNSSNSRILHHYITVFRPHVSKARGSALFPKESDGKPRSAGNLGQTVMAVIQRETGLTVNAHLFRHIAAYLYLKERPGQFEAVRRMLKHRKLQTTMDFYAELSNQWAHDHYDEVVLSKFGGRRD